MGVYNGETKASHSHGKRPHRSLANILSYLWNETRILISRGLYQKLFNAN